MSKVRRGKGSPPSEESPPDVTRGTPLLDVQSLLFHPQQAAPSASMIVPETPRNSPCRALGPRRLSAVLSVLETPEDEEPGVSGDAGRKRGAAPSWGDDLDGEGGGETPRRALDKRKRLLSLLESEHSFTQSLQSQKVKKSSMLFGPGDEGGDVPEDEGRIVSIGGGGGRRKRKSLAQVILPFDLNSSSASLSSKLDMMREVGRRTGSPGTPRRTPGTPRRTPVRGGKGGNAGGEETILFDSEDLCLTPVKSSSQILIERTVHSIIDKLSSQLGEAGGGPLVQKVSRSDERAQGALQSRTRSGGTPSKERPRRVLETEEEGRTATSLTSNPEMRRDGCEIPHEEPTSCETPQEEPATSQSELESTLKGVVAYVEVRMECDNRSAVIKDQLKALGAEVRERLTSEVTHVIFKDGSKSVFNRAVKRGLHLVSSLWVEACREKRRCMSEAQFPSCSMETYKKPLHVVKLRKLKSMQPREFSEEEKLAAARVQRRVKSLKSQGTPNSVPNDVLFGSPQNNSLKREAVDSPLFGISHLLTPQRENCGSSTEEEENSPLAKRLYNWFISPKGDNQKRQQRSQSRKERPTFDSSLEDIVFEGKSEKVDAKQDEGVQGGRVPNAGVGDTTEMPVRLSVESPETAWAPPATDRPNPKPRRSTRISGRSVALDDDGAPERGDPDPDGCLRPLNGGQVLTDSQRPPGLGASQSRGRRLLSVDVLEPSQDLIVPVTPDAPRRGGGAARGPYSTLKIKGSKSQRASQRNQKGSSSMPLPRNPPSLLRCSKAALKFSDSSESGSPSDEEEAPRLRAGSSSLGAPGLGNGCVSECKMRQPPRPRRSTDEFQFVKELKPKGKKKKGKSKSRDLPSMCLTSVTSKDKSSLLPIIKKLGGYSVTELVNQGTTHVVCGDARRTLNLLFGIARGCWILDVSWLYQSLEMEAWAPEEPFEIFTFCPAAKVCRQQKEILGTSYQQTLFSGVGSICVLDGCVPSSPQLKELLELCGAVLVSTARSANIVIGKCTSASEAKGGLVHVSEKWALDSLQQHKIQPLNDYKLE